MKKLLFSFLAFTVFTSIGFAAPCDVNKAAKTNCSKTPACETQKVNPCEEKSESCDIEKTTCEKCMTDDDEYCVYNQCFFDKQYKKMKKELCLTKKQEACIDNIYKNFKSDMESCHAKYRAERDKLLDMIECNNDCWKDQAKVLKEMKKEAKEKCKDFRDDVKEQLCKNQYSAFRKFQRCEKRKMKKLVKYGKVYKFPCTDCCK